nr:immunoglobulin light chain junction region [Macaca mulatta]MOX07539.1 immunoglobulin light chain junction region [Macaca mulatta]MOX07935.1 immunoglobulin light chain junction region [Macaca mulatta]MOX08237.1 immunoglobulin light chain junction region [Macaca mulatta]MOX08540.1 immunoglobulin light chain junction region [Macaca mulatta]
CMQGQEFPYSF